MKGKKETRQEKPAFFNKPIKRRDFLIISGTVAIGLALPDCGRLKRNINVTTSNRVALAKVTTYERKILKREINTMLDKIGGISDIISRGSKVAIKTNLTGGTKYSGDWVKNAFDVHWTHPEVVRAVGEALLDAGAKKLYIMDSIYERESWEAGGFNEIAGNLGAGLIDLNYPYPYNDFIQKKTGDQHYIYDSFIFNPLLNEVDAFVSIPKLKCHNTVGVTLSMKNHIGLVPARFYETKEHPGTRSGMHGRGNESDTRIPRVIIDLVRARPINLAIIDGIKSVEGGEGPWIKNTFRPVEPGILVAGKNPLMTDAVATAAMGFNPKAKAYEVPFVNSDNYLELAMQNGLGTINLDEIELVGESLKNIVFSFAPCKKEGYIL